ncbi:MAG: hypothetical protein ACOXZQ_14030 [Bacteroidales bacterium]|jgi:hypothetical protein
MSKENKTSDKQQNGNDFIADVSGSYFDSKPLTEMEYLEYMSKKAKTVHTIIYPDGSKGELNRGVVVLL